MRRDCRGSKHSKRGVSGRQARAEFKVDPEGLGGWALKDGNQSLRRVVQLAERTQSHVGDTLARSKERRAL